MFTSNKYVSWDSWILFTWLIFLFCLDFVSFSLAYRLHSLSLRFYFVVTFIFHCSFFILTDLNFFLFVFPITSFHSFLFSFLFRVLVRFPFDFSSRPFLCSLNKQRYLCFEECFCSVNSDLIHVNLGELSQLTQT